MSLDQAVHGQAQGSCHFRQMPGKVRRRHCHSRTEDIHASRRIRWLAQMVTPAGHYAVDKLICVDIGAVHSHADNTSSNVLIMPAAAIFA